MKKHREVKQLGEVCEFQNGFAFKSKTYKPSGSPILRITNIKNDSLDTNDLVYFDKKDYKEKFEKYEVFKGDLVIAMSGATTGKLGVNTTDTVFYLNQRVGKFLPKKELLKEYLYFYLSTKVEENLKISAGAAQPNLSTEQIRSFSIPLPTLPEQRRIVTILDEAFAAIATAKENAEKNLQNARELFESYLQSVFANPVDGWEEKKLSEIAEIFGGYAFKSGDFQKNGRYQVLRMGNVRPGIIRADERPVFIEKIDEKILSRSLLKPGDIIITQTGTRKKRDYGYTVSIDKSNYLLNQRLAAIRTSKNLDHQFFLYYSWSDSFRDQFFASETGTVGQGNVGMSAVTDAIIPLPPLPEQQSIVAKLDALSAETRKLEAIYQQKLADLDELKKSVLQKAFDGEL